jgi:hypothetical protein
MTNYVGFINSMLELRSQKLKEALAKAEMQQENMKSIGKAISGGLNSFTDSMKGMKQDAMANQLMQENSAALGGPDIRRAQAIDSAMQGPVDARASGMPSFYRGGMDELKTRMAMQEMRDKSMNTQIDNQRADRYLGMQQANIDTDNARLAEEAAARKERQGLLDQAKADELEAKKLTEKRNEEKSYRSQMRLYQHDMDNAKDPIQYGHAADMAISTNRGAIRNGMDVKPIEIGPFMTQETRDAIKLQEQAVSEAQKNLTDVRGAAPAPTWAEKNLPAGLVHGLGVDYSTSGVDAAQQKYDAEQQGLKDLRGQVTPYAPPPDNAAPAGASQGGGSMQTISSQEASAKSGKPIKPGTILTDKNGNRILVN